MIGTLRGKVLEIDLKSFIIDVGGVGYIVNTTDECISTIPEAGSDKQITVYTHLVVREDSMNIYGFFQREHLDFFELLITVSGIGPKTALGVLNTASIATLKTAIQTEDTSHLVKVAGVGKKMAEKIVMELKDKAGFASIIEKARKNGSANGEKRGEHDRDSDTESDMDVMEALKALGYREGDVREVLKKLSKAGVRPTDKSSDKTGEKIKSALKLLSNK